MSRILVSRPNLKYFVVFATVFFVTVSARRYGEKVVVSGVLGNELLTDEDVPFKYRRSHN
jgi:hypothetical protein